VLECSWSDLLVDIKELHDLDQLIAAHGKFLSALVTRTFLGEDSKSMLSQLRSIFDIIISFQKQQDEFYAAVLLLGHSFLSHVLRGSRLYAAPPHGCFLLRAHACWMLIRACDPML